MSVREIKFRAWDRIELRMRYDIGVIEFNAFDKTESTCVFNSYINEDSLEIEEVGKSPAEYYDANCFILLQYTGLKDKNGVEIYEGDIIRGPHDFGPGGFIVIATPVKYHVIHGYQLHYFLLDQTEVVGNIYENPEILKEYSQ